MKPYITLAMLAGGDREDTAPIGLRYASEFVDHYLLLRTGPSADKLIALARQHIPAEHLTIVDDPADEIRCADYRARLLRAAEGTGSAWACMLDTDDEIHARGFDIPGYLRQLPPEVQTVKVQHESGNFASPRFFRLPLAGQFVGEPHERYTYPGKTEIMPVALEILGQRSTDDNLRKQLAVRDALSARYRRLSAAELVFLGEAYHYTGEHAKSRAAYLRSARLSGSGLERAWALFLAARTFVFTGQLFCALRAAQEAAREYSSHPEILHLAARSACDLGLYELAALWATDCRKAGQAVRKYGRQSTWAIKGTWYELPWAVLADCSEAAGEPQMTEAFRSKYLREYEARCLSRG